MDNACTSNERLDILKILHDNGIYTILFMSPFFPYITDWMELIDISCSYVDEYQFENLNLRGGYKRDILEYIKSKYFEFYDKYIDIYVNKNDSYWKSLSTEISDYCNKKNIKFINYFYHKELVDKKKDLIKQL